MRTPAWFLLALAVAIPASGEAKPAAQPPRSAPAFDKTAMQALTWRSIGPYRGGRAVAAAGVESQPNTFYFGGTGGGVFKTTNGGVDWKPVTDGQIGTGSVGAIAVAESDPNVVYVGMGEACLRGNLSHGDGVYKSVDAGQTWVKVGLEETRHVGAVVVHPTNPDLVYVAAVGHAFGPNPQRGVFRSRDGGRTWDRIHFVDENTGAVALAMDPTNPRVLFAGMYQVRRTPWSFDSGGPGSGLWKSVDGGDTWKKLEGHGLPKGVWGRVDVSVSGADPNRVYAMVEAEEGGVFRSNDGGKTWTRTNDERKLRQRAWYYTHVYADPQNADVVYVLNVQFFRSQDGGKTFQVLRTPHGDNHDLWIAKGDPKRMISADDGGAHVSHDGGATWSRQDNQATAQFYHVIADDRFPYWIYGAQQDNSTVAIASRTSGFGIDVSDWHAVGGCESGYIAPKPGDPNIVYAGCYGGQITRYDHRTKQERDVTVYPENPMGWGAEGMKYRFQWTFPIVVSPHDAATVYAAGNRVFRTRDEGSSWEPISPDLTRNDAAKLGPSGGPITKDNTSVEYYGTVFAFAESKLEKGLLWAGSDDGLVHVSRDAGATWTNVTPKELPEWSLISQVDPSPHAAGTMFLAANRYKHADDRPFVYVTTDYGVTWKKITSGLPANAFVRVVRQDPVNPALLFAGTELGLFVSTDGGGAWQPLQQNLPVVPITDLIVKDDDVVVATQGRSFWVLDDIAPLRQMSKPTVETAAHLFEPSVAHRFFGLAFPVPNRGQNPPNGALFYYSLK
ncbi:MAG: glycosyl hydrolase, partial [Vicinamibacteria bacterium]|nr:glycosyl hydrolase [Vicinamibacteria bacterium]